MDMQWSVSSPTTPSIGVVPYSISTPIYGQSVHFIPHLQARVRVGADMDRNERLFPKGRRDIFVGGVPAFKHLTHRKAGSSAEHLCACSTMDVLLPEYLGLANCRACSSKAVRTLVRVGLGKPQHQLLHLPPGRPPAPHGVQDNTPARMGTAKKFVSMDKNQRDRSKLQAYYYYAHAHGAQAQDIVRACGL